MTIMASPASDAPRPSHAEVEVNKADTNGHTSPSPPKETLNGTASKPTDDDKPASSKPLVNGNGTTEEHATLNGDVKDEKPKSSSPEKSVEKEVDAKSGTKAASEDGSAPAPVPSDDVDMADSAPSKPATESTEKPAAETQPEPASEKDKAADAEMADKPSEDKAEPPSKLPASENAEAPKPAKETSDEKPSEVDTEMAESPAKEVEKETSAEKPSKVDTEMADKPSDPPAAVKSDEPASADALPTSEVDIYPTSMSQLAIESTEMDKSPTEPSADVSMTDAPSTKIARERDDDLSEEPAPKRARTEPRDDEPSSQMASDIIMDAPIGGEVPSLSSLNQWSDPMTNGKSFTPFQRREIRKFIAKIKKSKLGASFKDSVQKMWPGLWDSYVAKVEKPMDLAEIDRNLRDDRYPTVAAFKKDLSLIFDNSYSFNGPAHEVTLSAFRAVKATWEEALMFPIDDPVRPKPQSKPKPMREHRVSTSDVVNRRQSTGPATSPAAPAPTPAPQPKAAPAPVAPAPASVRRDSTAEGDRPKRTVRAPKPKDIDYSKPSRKKLKPELQFCDEVLADLMAPKNERLNMWFVDAVDAEGLGIPNYYQVIKKPMDMGKVSRMLSSGDISSLKDFDKNMRLIFTNCYTFNGPPDQGNPVSLVAQELEGLYNSLMKGKDSWLAKWAKTHAPATSNASDDEDEDDDDEDNAASGAAAADLAKEVRDLEAKLLEESTKLTQMFTADTPNQSMIEMQQTIVSMVQQHTLKAKQTLADHRQKHGKEGKKAPKAAKPKASAASAPRKSSNAGPPKKPGPKKSGKKNLSPGDKDAIANAINDLDYPHLDRAIDIIKRDTGQAVSLPRQ
jgi:bromodomain-containing factor 1